MRGARRDQEQDRHLLQPPDEEGEEGQRRLVGPLGVVDDHEQRPAASEFAISQNRPCRRGNASASSAPGGLHGRTTRRQVRGAGEQRLAFLRRRAVDDRVQQLVDQAVREVPLELARAGREDRHPVAVRDRRPRRAQEPGLADPGRPLDDDEPPDTRVRRLPFLPDHRELGLALVQPRRKECRPPGDPTPRCDGRVRYCSVW